MGNHNTCRFCGKELNEGYKSKLYCSHECGVRYRDRKRANKEKKSIKRECRTCKAEFIPNYKGTKTFDCSEKCYKEQRKKQNRERMRKENGWYDKYDYDDIKKCKGCNADISHMKINAMYCSTLCRQRVEDRKRGHKPLEEHLSIVGEQRKQRLARLEIEAKQRQRQRAISNIARLLNKEVLRRERVVELTRPCVECGTPFYNPHPHALTCTPLCSKRRANRQLKLYNSKRLNESNIVDRDITVQKLFDKYEGICYLCGKECDFNDKVITEEGYTIVGKTYPSIEHVIPISKGGMHSWDNVNLAHHYCNSIKSDKILFKNKMGIKNMGAL